MFFETGFQGKFEFQSGSDARFSAYRNPTALEQMALRFGVIMFLKIVSGLGNNVYAAHQIALNVLSLSYSPAQAFGITASSLMGQSLGAKDENWQSVTPKMCQRNRVNFSDYDVCFYLFWCNTCLQECIRIMQKLFRIQ